MTYRTAAAAAYGSLDNDALCIDADLIFDQLADEFESDDLFEVEAEVGSADYDALHLGVSRYS